MTDTASSPRGHALDPEQEGLTLPPDVELLEKVGTGRAGTVYKARYQGETVALKAYKRNAADWYRKKLDKNIAVYEMMQNRTFRKHPNLLKFTAKPIRVIGQDGKTSLCYLQEFVDGFTLEEYTLRHGKLPGYLMQTGEAIARICEDEGLAGVDEFMKGVRLRQTGATWMPVMFDFKHIPPERAKDSKPSLLSRLGVGRGQGTSSGFLKEWKTVNQRVEKG